ncbi:MAG: hypothetical protein L6Q38_14720, partial [Nitrospira sp.]|nr:hypothetical protein [Nitrospira sp.]
GLLERGKARILCATKGQKGLRKRAQPWKLRRGIFANCVVGSVAWRRILILLNDYPHQVFEATDAKNRNVRLSLKTADNFKRLFRRRIMGGVVLFLLAAIGTLARSHVLVCSG